MKTNFCRGITALLLLLGLPLAGRSQSVGIGTTTPDARAALDIRATDKGLLVPRLSAAQRTAIAAPPQGLMVYQTDGTAGGGAGTGFWYFGGNPAAWVFINPAGAGDNLGNHTATQSLNLQANALVGTGASVGTAVGVGVRADGGLNLGQNTAGNNVLLGYQAGAANTTGSDNHFVGYQAGATNTRGYSNHFEGNRAGQANTFGFLNHFEGNQAGQANTTGYVNQFSGYRSGYNNTIGNNNVFSGYLSGYSNTTGEQNQFSGVQSGISNTTGNRNQFNGYQSGLYNTTGKENHFSGYQSGYLNTASNNHFVGYQAGYNNETGDRNQFSGYQSGYNNTTGGDNYFSGYQAGQANTKGNFGHFVGVQAGQSNTTGFANHFSGLFSGLNNTIGNKNQFTGTSSGYSNSAGNNNYFSGYQSGYFNTASNNHFVGYQSGFDNTTGSNNTGLGYQAGPTTGNLTNAGALGYLAKVSQSNSLVLGGAGSNAVQVGIGTPAPAARLHVYGSGPTILRVQSSDGFGTAGLDFWSDPQGSQSEWRPVALRSADAGNYTGQLVFYTNGTGYANRQAGVEQMRLVNGGLAIGTTVVGAFRLYVAGTVGATGGFATTSDQRLKTAIRPLTGALALVQALHGRRYRWNALGVARGGTADREQVGLLAQELARVLPELVSTGPDGYQAVNYAQLAPVLIEAIKELKAESDAANARANRAEATRAGFEQRLRALEAGGGRAQASLR